MIGNLFDFRIKFIVEFHLSLREAEERWNVHESCCLSNIIKIKQIEVKARKSQEEKGARNEIKKKSEKNLFNENHE